MSCTAAAAEQRTTVCVGVCVSEQRLALIWGCFKSYWLRLSLLHCVRVLGIHECSTVCACVCVCLCLYASFLIARIFARSHTVFFVCLAPPHSHSSMPRVCVFVCVCECARLGLEVSKCNFACLELFVLLSSCLCLCLCRHLCLRLRLRLCCCFSFSPISFQFLFFSFFAAFCLVGGDLASQLASPCWPLSLPHSLSLCLCRCVSNCAWADLNFMVSSILPSCNIKLN